MPRPTITQMETIREFSRKLDMAVPIPKSDQDARFVIDDLIRLERKQRRRLSSFNPEVQARARKSVR